LYVRRAGVVGAGIMGGQIAQTIAAAGIEVALKDVDAALLDAAVAEARRVTAAQLAKLVERGRLDAGAADAEVDGVVGRIAPTLDYAPFGDVDVVVEAVPERIEVKQAVFAELDACVPGRALLASNTSSLSIDEIAEATGRADRVVGFHYFYPASLMPLIEIVEGEETSTRTLTDAVAFAQQIRKQPILCLETPGFVVNRILTAAMSEIWREQEKHGLSIAAIDEGLVGAGAAPVGPYRLVDLLGLDTVLHVAEYLADSYGEERFHVPEAMQRQVANGRLGAKSGGDGFYASDGTPRVEGAGEPDIAALAEMVRLKGFVEACLILEEGVASHRDIDVGMMAGAGMEPGRKMLPPFMQADADGLDSVLTRLEAAVERFGERFAPPAILRRLVAQGRLGRAAGEGFYAYPPAGAETVQLQSDGEVAVAWLNHGAMNSLSPQLVAALSAAYDSARESGAQALVIASANPLLFCAGADIKDFQTLDESAGRAFIDDAHALMARLEGGPLATVAAVNGVAYGGGCELAMACDVRIAARSALFGQPEIKLGIIPGFGGTQRLPRLVGATKAAELNLSGDPMLAQEAFEVGLADRVVEDHELHEQALMWAAQLAARAPLARAAIKELAAGALRDGIDAERDAFAAVFASDDAREGIAAFLAKRNPRFKGR